MSKHQLSEAEVCALRDEAHELMLNDAVERISWPAEHTDSMLGASEVYGTLAKIRFAEVKGLPSPDPEPEIQFTDRAMAWMRKLRDELRNSTIDQRGTIESNENTATALYVLYILDGICGGES